MSSATLDRLSALDPKVKKNYCRKKSEHKQTNTTKKEKKKKYLKIITETFDYLEWHPCLRDIYHWTFLSPHSTVSSMQVRVHGRVYRVASFPSARIQEDVCTLNLNAFSQEPDKRRA